MALALACPDFCSSHDIEVERRGRQKCGSLQDINKNKEGVYCLQPKMAPKEIYTKLLINGWKVMERILKRDN